jgi:hypothetical protein
MLGIDDLAEFPAVGQLLLKNPHANIRLKVFGVLQDIATYDTGHGAPKVATAHDGDLVERLGVGDDHVEVGMAGLVVSYRLDQGPNAFLAGVLTGGLGAIAVAMYVYSVRIGTALRGEQPSGLLKDARRLASSK